ncbi:MAG: RDD family protein [Solirubrobacteraceae bacterium]
MALNRRQARPLAGQADLDAESEGDKPRMTRLLSAGAKGAERVAQVAGVDRALNDAVEEAMVRALRSPAVIRAIERALDSRDGTTEVDSDEIAQIIARVLASEAAQHAWAEILASEQAQMLVERVAGAPEIRDAIAAQGAGLVTDIGVRLTDITEELDDALERVVRPRTAESETVQAGLATRSIAGGIDLGLLFAAYALVSGAVASVVSAVFGQTPSTAAIVILTLLGLTVGGGIFATFWALAGQTPGMRFLSIRLTHHGSHEITLGRAVRRVCAVILSLLPLGLGYLAILRDPRRRSWADRMTGTQVIYDHPTRAAPHTRTTSTAATAARRRDRER